MPHPTAVKARAVIRRGARSARIVVHVTASIFGAGMNELGSDTRPIQRAIVFIAGRRLVTDARGMVTLTLPEGLRRRRYRLRVTAGDTFIAGKSALSVPGRGRSST